MKGGGHEYRWDVRREWKCARCERTQKSSGSITSMLCNCTEPKTQMQLVGLPPHGFPNSPEATKAAVHSAATRRREQSAAAPIEPSANDFRNYELESTEEVETPPSDTTPSHTASSDPADPEANG